jgi:hypothetical protein
VEPEKRESRFACFGEIPGIFRLFTLFFSGDCFPPGYRRYIFIFGCGAPRLSEKSPGVTLAGRILFPPSFCSSTPFYGITMLFCLIPRQEPGAEYARVWQVTGNLFCPFHWPALECHRGIPGISGMVFCADVRGFLIRVSLVKVLSGIHPFFIVKVSS